MNLLLQRTGRPAFSPAIYLFAGVVFVRFYLLWQLSASAFVLPERGDMHFYNDWALRILHGQWTDGQAFYGLPLYPYLLAGLYKVFGYNPFLPGALQGLADGGTAVILYKLGLHLFGPQGRAIGLLAAAAWAFFIPAQAYSIIVMPTALATFVFWFVVWQIAGRDHFPGHLRVLALGLLIGFTAMGVATVLFLIPLFVAALFLKWQNQESNLHRLGRVVLFLVGLGLGLAPCWAHNYFIAHEPVVLSAHSGVNFWIGNNPRANGYPRMPPGLHSGQEAMLQDSITVAQKESRRKMQRAEVSEFWSDKARTYIKDNPAQWLRLVAQKIANFWNAFQYDDLSVITYLQSQGILLPGIKFGLVAVLGLGGLFLAGQLATASRWVTAAIVLQMLSLLTVFVTERYRLAVVPGLLLFASFGLVEGWRSLVSARYLRVLSYAAAVSLATLLVSIPRNDPSLWALDPYNSGWQALQAKNYSLAKEKLDLAYAYVPENAEINFALGNLQLEQNQATLAKSYYLTTLKLDATHEGAWNNLGVLALEERRWELAAKFLQGALRASPNDPKTHYLLARSYLHQGAVADARLEAATAIRLRPDQREFLELKNEIEQSQPE